MASPRLILASSSPRRSMLLETIAIKPDEIIAPDIDETEKKGEKPFDLAKRLCFEKNKAVNHKYAGDIIITADTVVSAGRFILPKAEKEDDFRLCMEKISGRRHKIMTGVCVCDPQGVMRVKVVTSEMKIKKLTSQDIEMLFKFGEWKGKAGGYALQGVFGQFIQKMSGSYSAIIGLPVYETANMLKAAGYKQNL